MYIFLAMRSSDILNYSKVVCSDDYNSEIITYISTRENPEDAFTEFVNKMIERFYDTDENLSQNLDFFDEFEDLRMFDILETKIPDILIKFKNRIKVETRLKELSGNNTEEKLLYEKLKRKYEGGNR